MPLVNMKWTAEEAAEYWQPSELQAPEYPPGLSLSLSEEDLVKLGFDLPRAGQTVRITAEAVITSVNESVDKSEGEPEACVRLQLTDMEMKDAPKRKSLAQKMYPGLKSEAE